jgi:hypothetical protein
MTVAQEPSTEPRAPRSSNSGTLATLSLVAFTPLLCVLGSFFGFVSIYASSGLCDGACGAVANGSILAMLFAPWAIWLASSGWAIVRLIRQQRATSVMTKGLLLNAVVYAVAFLVAHALIPMWAAGLEDTLSEGGVG